MAWTKASVDAGQHTYAEALTLLQAAGYTKDDLDRFLYENPGDLYRVPEAFDLSTGGYDPISGGGGTGPIITAQSLPPLPSVTSGGEASLFLTLGATPVPSSSQPARELSSIYSLQAGAGVAGVSATMGAAPRIPWMLLLVIAAGVWFVAKGGAR